MTKKKTWLLIFVLLAAGALLLRRSPLPDQRSTPKTEFDYYKQDDQDLVSIDLGQNQTLEVDQKTFQKLSQDEQLPNFSPLYQYCLNQYPEFYGMPEKEQIIQVLTHPDRHLVWTNIHLETEEGIIYRVRTFLDDGENTLLNRLVVYREDDNGFPEILDIPDSHRTNPSPEVLNSYLKKGQIIHQEQAFGLEVEEGDYFFEVHNEELIRFDMTSSEGHLNCLFPAEEFI